MVLQVVLFVLSSTPLPTEMMGTDLDPPASDCQMTVAACHGGNKTIQAKLSSSFLLNSIIYSIPSQIALIIPEYSVLLERKQ